MSVDGTSFNLRLATLCFAGHAYGYGHLYRSQALANTARQMGYTVFEISNYPIFSEYWISEHDIASLHAALVRIKPDWLIIDLPTISREISITAHELGIKTCFLNGVGHQLETELADLVWIQDMPERIILRPKFTNHKTDTEWFVYGGGADELGLLPCFSKAMPDVTAYLIDTNLTSYSANIVQSRLHELVRPDNIQILDYMQHARRAVLHMGMNAWELAALGKSIYLFSRDEGHLYFAQHMAELNLALAFPRVGLPEVDELRNFLATDFTPSGKKPDGLGAQRLLKELKDYLET